MIAFGCFVVCDGLVWCKAVLGFVCGWLYCVCCFLLEFGVICFCFDWWLICFCSCARCVVGGDFLFWFVCGLFTVGGF